MNNTCTQGMIAQVYVIILEYFLFIRDFATLLISIIYMYKGKLYSLTSLRQEMLLNKNESNTDKNVHEVN